MDERDDPRDGARQTTTTHRSVPVLASSVEARTHRSAPAVRCVVVPAAEGSDGAAHLARTINDGLTTDCGLISSVLRGIIMESLFTKRLTEEPNHKTL
jgi:hypothetical protein